MTTGCDTLWGVTSERDAIVRSLLHDRTVDIITTGRRTGRPRATEIWTTCLFGEVFICGTPNASRNDVEHQPRDWMANLLAEPGFVLRLKAIDTDLAATAEPVTEPGERRRILSQESTAYYRDALGIEAAVRHSPIVRVTFVGDGAWLNDAVRAVRE
jgi:hypothetical protein